VEKSCPMCGADAPDDAARCACGYAFASPQTAIASVEASELTRPSSAADSWTRCGWAAVVLGAIGLALSLLMKTSVEAAGVYGATSEIVNIDLQFHKGLAVAGSLFAIGLGVFCLGIGAVLRAVSDAGRP